MRTFALKNVLLRRRSSAPRLYIKSENLSTVLTVILRLLVAHFIRQNFPKRILLIASKIAAGKIKSIDTSAAENLPGVISVITYENAPKLQPLKTFMELPEAAIDIDTPDDY